MSWNGATEYDNWVVYSASDNTTSSTNTKIGSADRAGFETSVTVPIPTEEYIQVVAQQGDNVLGTSEFVTF
jgi:hypothetical protein